MMELTEEVVMRDVFIPSGACRLYANIVRGQAGAIQMHYLKTKDCIPPLMYVRMVIDCPTFTPPSYHDTDSVRMWLSVQLEQVGWVPPFRDPLSEPADAFEGWCGGIHHFFDFTGTLEGLERLRELAEDVHSGPPVPARSKMFKSNHYLTPINSDAHRVTAPAIDFPRYLEVACEKCGATKGERCKTKEGKQTGVHAIRKNSSINLRTTQGHPK